MRYGSLEYGYAEPFAEALVTDRAFREWVLSQTKFRDRARGTVVLSDEMKARRAKSAQSWWRSHFTESCRCQGCSGQETDVMAVFETSDCNRFAIHFEVKQPSDRFPKDKDQAANYAIRARCWITKPPPAVLPHKDADTVLLCSEVKLSDYTPHLTKFGAVITFEDIARSFPQATHAGR